MKKFLSLLFVLAVFSAGRLSANPRLGQMMICPYGLAPEAAQNEAQAAQSVDFERHFCDSTLRIHYIFAGDTAAQHVFFDAAEKYAGWAGRRIHLDALPLAGDGQLRLLDPETRGTLYATSFSTLFHEWLTTEEATQRSRSFENVFLLPLPRREVLAEVRLFDKYGRVMAEHTCRLDPTDILLRDISRQPLPPHKWLLRSGSPSEKIDMAIVAEGYAKKDAKRFYADAQKAMDALFRYEGFRRNRDKFNIVAVALPSEESGVSVPKDGEWRTTAVGSHFSTFYSDRYLTTLRLRALHEQLASLPYEHLIILANTPEYGGGGIYNSYTLTTAGHWQFESVVVHEFGHSFAGLADEYAYDDEYDVLFPTDREPWQQNITTLTDFQSKWADMLPAGTAVPTPLASPLPARYEDASAIDYRSVGVYEGAGYQSRGVFRPTPECLMKICASPDFCPVCTRAIDRLIHFYCP